MRLKSKELTQKKLQAFKESREIDRADRSMKWMDLYAIDTETTHSGRHEIAECVEIAIIRIDVYGKLHEVVFT